MCSQRVHGRSVSQLCLTLCNSMACRFLESCLVTKSFGLFETLWTAAHQLSLSFSVSWSLLKLISIKSVVSSNHPSQALSPPSPLLLNLSQHQGLFNESALHIRWPKYWSFSSSVSPSNEYSVLISFRMDWLDLLLVQGTLKSSPAPQFEPVSMPLYVLLSSLCFLRCTTM